MTQSTPSDFSDDLIVIYSAGHEAEAAVVVNALTRAGVMSKMHGEFTAGFRAEAPGDVKILIHPSDETAAKAVLRDIETDEEIDWDNVDIGESEA